MESSHTQRGRECGGASKQKLNFVSRLKLKIAFVVRVNSEGSPEERAVAPQKWWQASKPDCCCHVLLSLPLLLVLVWHSRVYNKIRTNDNKEVQIKSQLELTAKWKRPQNYNHNDVRRGRKATWERCQWGCEGMRGCGRGGAANKSRLQISSANLFCSRALWRAWGTIMEARQEQGNELEQRQGFPLPSPPAYPCR